VIVFGIAGFGNSRQRGPALRSLQTVKDGAKLVLVPDFLQATVRALHETGEGEVAAVAGSLDDVALPSDHDGFGSVEWQESWLAYLEAHHIAFLPLVSGSTAKAKGEVASIIRGYNRAFNVLTEVVRKIQAEQRRGRKHAEGGYICGRPPYGYTVSDGSFVVNDVQARAVKFIFKQIRAGKALSYIIEKLLADFAEGGVIEGKAQYWDRVKVRRILNHRRLYCLGEYSSGRSGPSRSPDLAFLPKEWVDTDPSKTPAALAAT
jgi:hypothetical protein